MSEPTKKQPPYLWWMTAFITAALFGCAITGFVPWWAVLIPFAVFYAIVIVLLVLVFAIGFLGVLIVAYAEHSEEKKRNREYERKR